MKSNEKGRESERAFKVKRKSEKENGLGEGGGGAKETIGEGDQLLGLRLVSPTNEVLDFR